MFFAFGVIGTVLAYWLYRLCRAVYHAIRLVQRTRAMRRYLQEHESQWRGDPPHQQRSVTTTDLLAPIQSPIPLSDCWVSEDTVGHRH